MMVWVRMHLIDFQVCECWIVGGGVGEREKSGTTHTHTHTKYPSPTTPLPYLLHFRPVTQPTPPEQGGADR